jgi:hypothetical protein
MPVGVKKLLPVAAFVAPGTDSVRAFLDDPNLGGGVLGEATRAKAYGLASARVATLGEQFERGPSRHSGAPHPRGQPHARCAEAYYLVRVDLTRIDLALIDLALIDPGRVEQERAVLTQSEIFHVGLGQHARGC